MARKFTPPGKKITKPRKSRRRWALKSDEFAPLHEIVAETVVDDQSLGMSLYIPFYDRVTTIDWWVSPHSHWGSREDIPNAHLRELEYIQRDIATLIGALEHLNTFIDAQRNSFDDRVMRGRREQEAEVARRKLDKPSESES